MKNFVNNGEHSSRLFRKNIDGTNRIIANGENCLVPASRAFWKYIEDVSAGVKTCSQYKKQEVVDQRTFDTYFRNKNREERIRWLTVPDLEIRILKNPIEFTSFSELPIWSFNNSEQ